MGNITSRFTMDSQCPTPLAVEGQAANTVHFCHFCETLTPHLTIQLPPETSQIEEETPSELLQCVHCEAFTLS